MSLSGGKKEKNEEKNEEKKDSAESLSNSAEESSEAEKSSIKDTRLNLTAMTARSTAPTLAAAPLPYAFIDLANSDRLAPPGLNDPLLLYDNLARGALINQYRSTAPSTGYVSFALRGLDETLPGDQKYREQGLKIHISLDDEDEGNIKKGWNAIANILSYYNIARSKVVQLEEGRSIDKISRASDNVWWQITIYASLHQMEASGAMC